MGRAKPLHLRLFLEGIEVPVISAQVSVSLFAPAAAAIQVVPLDEGLYFKPRTMVHLFFLEEPEVRVDPTVGGTGYERELLSARESEFGDTAYKLLFCGEVIGFSMVKQPMARGLVLQCLDFSSYWDSLYATMLDWSPQGNALVNKSALYGSEIMFSSLPMNDPAHRLRAWLGQAPQTPGLKNVGGLAGGIIHMMERMGGTYSNDSGGAHTLGVNDFYTIAELRCHLMQQIVAEENDSTATRLLGAKVFWEWLFNTLQGAGPQVTLRDMFKLLCQYIYYAIVPNPTAKFDHDNSKSTVTVGPRKITLEGMPDFLDGRRYLQDGYGLAQAKDPLDVLTATYSRQTLVKSSSSLAKVKDIEGNPKAKIDSAITMLEEYSKKYQGGLKEESARSERASILASLNEASILVEAAAGKVVKTTASRSYDVAGSSRLRSQVFRPDCYMAAPPVCNIVFPEMYSTLNYDRNYMNEATRVEIMTHAAILRLQDTNQTNANLFASHWLAPSILKESKEVLAHFRNKWRILMPHERHTGIVAQQEWTTDMFSSLNMSEAEKHAHITWQQMTGLHHFFKYRIGPRTLNVSGRFNPYMVAGFPALVLQKPFIPEGRFLDGIAPDKVADYVAENGLALDVPPQFLGMVEGLQHSVGQEGGLTSFTMSHCRTHLGIDDDFIGAVLAEAKATDSQVERIHYPLVYPDVQSRPEQLAFLVDCTPQGTPLAKTAKKTKTAKKSAATYRQASLKGSASTTTNVSSTTVSNDLASGSYVQDSPLPWDPSKMTKTPNGGKISVGAKGLYGGKVYFVEVVAPDVVKLPGGRQVFSAVMVYEDIQVSLAGAEMPVEEIIRPKWLAPVYGNDKIGKDIYQPFFGCGSVLDRVVYVKDSTLPVKDEDGTMVLPDESVDALKARVTAIAKAKTFYGLERAVNVLSYIYGQVRRAGAVDVDEFITTLVRRPIATKRDLLGTFDLDVQVVNGEVQIPKGQAGFHTLSVNSACSQAGNLTGLTSDPAATLQRMDSKNRETMAAMYDVRKAKLDRVMKYRAALDKSAGRGFLG